jgi:hypothetical protein
MTNRTSVSVEFGVNEVQNKGIPCFNAAELVVGMQFLALEIIPEKK